MSYYNIKANNWSRIETKPIELKVIGEESQPITGSGLTKKEIELIGEDIRFIKTKLVPNSISLMVYQQQHTFYIHYQS